MNLRYVNYSVADPDLQLSGGGEGGGSFETLDLLLFMKRKISAPRPCGLGLGPLISHCYFNLSVVEKEE